MMDSGETSKTESEGAHTTDSGKLFHSEITLGTKE